MARCAAPSSPWAISTASAAATRQFAAAEERAKGLGKPAAVLTFEPHPRAFFHPQEPLFRLTDESGKLRLLASTGLDAPLC